MIVRGKHGEVLCEVPEDTVCVDVGSGNRPQPTANVLVDLYPYDNTHRERRAPLQRDHRPLIEADVQDLPFADKSVGTISASHVLEHIDDPAAACAELQRVARWGIITFPSWMLETRGTTNDPDDWDHHRWVIEMVGRELVFREKPWNGTGHRTMPPGGPMGDEGDKPFLWEDRFDVRVIRAEEVVQ